MSVLFQFFRSLVSALPAGSRALLVVQCPSPPPNLLNKIMDEKELDPQRLLANFMSASALMETYLQQGGQLTPLQLESLSLTIEGLQSFLDIWKRKHGIGIKD